MAKRIYVGNLPPTATHLDVLELFMRRGVVLDVHLVTDRETGRHRGFGFVEMGDNNAEQAISALNGHVFKGHKLNVARARPRRQRPPAARNTSGPVSPNQVDSSQVKRPAQAASEPTREIYFNIREACEQLDLQPYVLRYWETEFPALSPSKTTGGQRVYGRGDLRVIRRLKELLYEEGYTIAGAKKKLEEETESGIGRLDPASSVQSSSTRIGSRQQRSTRPKPAQPVADTRTAATADIFLSYAKKDRKRASSLAHALERLGWSVFWDKEIPAGASWLQHIENQLDSCKCLIVAWSTNSLSSDWVEDEALEGKRRKILLPVMLEAGIEPPFGFRNVQSVNLADWEGDADDLSFQKLISGITRYLGPPPITP